MDKLTYVLAELKRRKGLGQIGIVAELAGLTRRTMNNVMSKRFNPSLDTLNALYEVLKRNDKRKGLK